MKSVDKVCLKVANWLIDKKCLRTSSNKLDRLVEFYLYPSNPSFNDLGSSTIVVWCEYFRFGENADTH